MFSSFAEHRRRVKAYRKALGFKPATCWMFLVSWPWSSCNRLNDPSSTGDNENNVPSVAPIMSFDWGIDGSSLFRIAMTVVVLYSTCPWNSVRSKRCFPTLESGSVSASTRSSVITTHHEKHSRVNKRTLWIVLVNPNNALLVPGHYRQLPIVREEKVSPG